MLRILWKRDHFWFTSHSISKPTSINVYNGTIVHVKYSAANKAGCCALRTGLKGLGVSICCEGLGSVTHAPKCAYMYLCARVSENF